jgi:hypothetical protein
MRIRRQTESTQSVLFATLFERTFKSRGCPNSHMSHPNGHSRFSVTDFNSCFIKFKFWESIFHVLLGFEFWGL